MTKNGLSRRHMMALGAGATFLAWGASANGAEAPLITRAIPKSGEKLPVVGLGTAVNFENGGDAQERAALTGVVRALVDGGGTVLDTAPSYGEAENVVGDILNQTGLRKNLFLATKLSRGDRQNAHPAFKASLQRLHADSVDLMQLHNVNDANLDLAVFRDWKAQGLCRYIGITTTSNGAYDEAEAIMKREKPDFVQIDYAIDNRDAEARIIPVAADNGVAVLTALPFGRGRLFRTALGKPLPDFAKEFDAASWGQFFLKYLIGNPAVTVTIPGTSNPRHMTDNIGAARGAVPTEAQRAQMVRFAETL